MIYHDVAVTRDAEGLFHLASPLVRELWISKELLDVGCDECLVIDGDIITLTFVETTARYKLIGPRPHHVSSYYALFIDQTGDAEVVE